MAVQKGITFCLYYDQEPFKIQQITCYSVINYLLRKQKKKRDCSLRATFSNFSLMLDLLQTNSMILQDVIYRNRCIEVRMCGVAELIRYAFI